MKAENIIQEIDAEIIDVQNGTRAKVYSMDQRYHILRGFVLGLAEGNTQTKTPLANDSQEG